MKKSSLLLLISSMFLMAGCGGGDADGDSGEGTGGGDTQHTFAEAWTNDATSHWHACNVSGCPDISGKADHTFKWVTDEDATYEGPGSKHEECTVCKYAKSPVEIPQLVHHYEEDWSYNNEQHWHNCTDEGFEDKENAKDLGNHVFEGLSEEIAPTYTEDGQTPGGTCTVCEQEIQGYTIPKLNETDYTRTATNTHKQTLTETWTLKDPASIGKDEYVVTKTYNWGFVTVCDYSTGKQVKHDYSAYEFNKTFEGIKITLDEKNKTMTFNVTKEGGYTFENACLTFPAAVKTTVTITGEPLTILAPEGCEDDGISFWGSTTIGNMYTAIIDTEVSIIYDSSYEPCARTGVNESILTINQGASLTVSGFDRGITANYTPINVNGTLVVSGVSSSIVSSSTSKNRTININEALDLYFDGTFVQTGGTTTTDAIKNGSVKKVAIIPTGNDIGNY